MKIYFFIFSLFLIIFKAQAEIRIVHKIELVIPPSFTESELLEPLEKLKNQPFDPAQVNRLLKELYLTEKFHNISIFTEEVGREQMVLKFVFELSQRIQTISFQGNHLFSDVVLLKTIEAKEEQLFQQDSLLEDKQKLEHLYEEEGYYQTKIRLRFFAPKESHQFQVVFEIEEGVPARIESLRIESIGRPKSKEIQSFFPMKRGDLFKKEPWKEQVFTLSKSFFQDFYLDFRILENTISLNEDKSGIHLKLLIKPGAKYFFDFSGAHEFSKYDLLRQLTLTSDEILPKITLQDLIHDITQQYRQRGYAHLQIETQDRLDLDKNIKFVTFHIQEGPAVQIEGYQFTKFSRFSSRYYENLIHQSVKWPLSRNIYSPDDLDEIPPLIENHLKSLGFLFSKAHLQELIWNIQKTSLIPVIEIEEGPQTRIRDIQFSGNTHFSAEHLHAVVPFSFNAPLNLFELDKSLAALVALYREHGFLQVKVQHADPQKWIAYSPDYTEATIHIHIQEGPEIRIDHIIIQGAQRTKHRVIERELEIHPSEIWNPEKVKQTENNLVHLGLFSHVELRPASGKFVPGKNDLLISVVERKPGLLEMGTGFKSDDGFHGFTGVAYRNVGGWHRVISARADINRKIQDYTFLERNIDVGISDPYFGGIPFVARFEVNHEKESTLPFDIRGWEGKLSLDKHLWHFLNLSFYYTYKFRDIFRAKDPKDIQQKKLASIGSTIFFDFRDDAFNPRKGSTHTLASTFFLPALGGDQEIDLSRTLFSSSFYYSPFSFVTLALYSGVGYAYSFAQDDPIPVDQRFYLGGRSSIRGFKEDIIGSDTKNKSIFKTSFLNYKTELRFHVTESFGLLAFFDGGNVFFDSPVSHGQFRHSAGPGLLYNTPVGPLSLDFGFIINRDRTAGEPVGRVHFSLGLF
ncbi:MAG: BamA/TamA family outer membrane protein [Deltaproteobacteria bacterium]|nr:BamA/TamA family outer membrane protein [Deltaproteobacteria bacterium]